MSDHVEVRKDLPSGTIIINRPDKRNALTPRLVSELQTAFNDLHGERKVRGVILTGAAGSFCSGSDLTHLFEQMQCPDPESFWLEEIPDLQALIESILHFPKPVIAAVDGPVRGTGMALMLACDYILATDSSTFGLPEATRGLVPGFAAPLLARRCGAGFVNRMLMSGATIKADQARTELMIDEIVKADLVWARAQQMVAEFIEAAPTSLQLTRQLVNQTIGEELFTQLSIGAANTAAARSTDDAKKGVEAFINKTKPDWFG